MEMTIGAHVSWRKFFALLGGTLILAGDSSSVDAAASAKLVENRVVFQSEFIEMTFVPDNGARCTSFKYRDTEYQQSSSGSFEDRLWEVAGYDLPKASYQATILESSPDRAVVQFRAHPQTPGFTRLEVTRSVTLSSGRTDVEIATAFTNHDKQPLPVGFWVVHGFHVPGDENVMTFPSPKGLDRLYFNPGKFPRTDPRNSSLLSKERFIYDNPRGFFGFHTTRKQLGLAISCDLPGLSFLYNFATDRLVSTEFAFNEINVPPGETVTHRYVLTPFHGLPSFEGAGDGVVLSLQLPEKLAEPGPTPVTHTIISSRPRTLMVRTRTKPLPAGGWKTVNQQSVQLATDQPQPVAFDWTPAASGTHVVNVQVLDGETELFNTEQPVVVREASGEYVMTTDIQRRGTEMVKYRTATKAYMEDPARLKEVADKFSFFRELDASVVTPHIPFATPLAGGPLRALLMPSWFAGREVIELSQRLELDYRHVALLREIDWQPFGSKEATLFKIIESRLVEFLGQGDPVIALSSSPCPWNDLREPTKTALLDAVKEGRGLVYCGDIVALQEALGQTFVPDPVAAKKLQCAMPLQQRRAAVQAGQFGQGRVVLLSFPVRYKNNSFLFHQTGGGLRYLHDPERESAVSIFARALLWAARREPAVAVELPETVTARSDKVKGTTIAVPLKGATVATLDWVVQPAGDRPPIPGLNPKISPPGETAELRLPALEAGPYTVWATALDAAGAVIGWGTAQLNVETDTTLTAVFDRSSYALADQAQVTVIVAKPSGPTLRVRCELTDSEGRLMAVETKPLGGASGEATVVFTFPLRLAAAKMAIAHATLLDGDVALVSARAKAGVAVPRTRGFRYIPHGNYLREVKELVGMQGMMDSSEWAGELNLDNYLWSDMPGFHLSQDVQFPMDKLVREPCLSDPVFLQQAKQWSRDTAAKMKPYGDLAVIIADEWNFAGRGARTTNLCHSPSCEQAFREFLKAEYGSLEKLNASWGSQYRDWNEITSPLWDDVQKSGNYVPWIDKRRAQETVVADFIKTCNDAGRAVYSNFQIALSGTHNPAHVDGYDWWKLMNALGAVSIYGGPQMALARSFARPGQLVTRWVGYDTADNSPGRGAQRIWNMMFNGLGGATDFATARYSPLFWPDLTPRRYGKAVAGSFQAMQQGAGDIIANATMENDGVAILYSHPSVHMAAVEGARGRPITEGTYVNTLSSWEALLRDLGFQFRYVAGEQVADGALTKSGYRLLVIPFSLAVSPEQIEQIKRFVDNGGVVLADLAPAVTDLHGKLYGSSPLDPVLGVRRASFRASYRHGVVQVDGQASLRLEPGSLELMQGESNLVLAGGKAWGSFVGDDNALIPAVIHHSFGRGRSVLLNFGLADYQGYRAGGEGGEESVILRARAEKTEALKNLMRGVLDAVGIRPRIVVATRPPAGSDFSTRFCSGEAIYLGLSDLPENNHQVSISLRGLGSAPRHVYDVRARNYLGIKTAIERDMTNSFAEVLALMPTKIGVVNLTGPAAADRGQAVTITVKLEDWIPTMGLTVFRMEVYRPDGTVEDLYTRNLVTETGQADFALPVALNDPAGPWRIVATEVVSGNKDDLNIHVK